jgi:hypothetical protein
MNQKRIYVPPQSVDLSDFSARGGGVGPMGVCESGTFPWNGCNEGANFGPNQCTSGGKATIGNNCNVGPTPNTGTTQCAFTGSNASNTCHTGKAA